MSAGPTAPPRPARIPETSRALRIRRRSPGSRPSSALDDQTRFPSGSSNSCQSNGTSVPSACANSIRSTGVPGNRRWPPIARHAPASPPRRSPRSRGRRHPSRGFCQSPCPRCRPRRPRPSGRYRSHPHPRLSGVAARCAIRTPRGRTRTSHRHPPRRAGSARPGCPWSPLPGVVRSTAPDVFSVARRPPLTSTGSSMRHLDRKERFSRGPPTLPSMRVALCQMRSGEA